MQDGLAHAPDVLGSLVLARAHVNAAGHLLPAGLQVQLLELIPAFGLLVDIVLGASLLLLFLAGEEIFKLAPALLFALLLVLPFAFLRAGSRTLLALRML